MILRPALARPGCPSRYLSAPFFVVIWSWGGGSVAPWRPRVLPGPDSMVPCSRPVASQQAECRHVIASTARLTLVACFSKLLPFSLVSCCSLSASPSWLKNAKTVCLTLFAFPKCLQASVQVCHRGIREGYRKSTRILQVVSIPSKILANCFRLLYTSGIRKR